MTLPPEWQGLLGIAEGDHKACLLLLDADVPFAMACFHAQQAVEKYFKVVFRRHKVRYPFTHDLVVLVNLAEKHGITLPISRERLENLNPFGVQNRYDLPPESPISRSEIEEIVDLVANWCQKQLHDR